MLIAHVTFRVAPDSLRIALDALMSEVPVVRRMKGCQAFIPFADPTVEGGLGLIHEWDSGEDFAAYVTSPGFAEVNARLRPLMTEPPVSRRFDARLAESVN
ncbi:MAG TPA: antibiotic biosynthesis monooxygenase [Asticcacaulis sp.]|nr:antibiotic biosynthesis monooxygenase [Asticcacaulis sp.]